MSRIGGRQRTPVTDNETDSNIHVRSLARGLSILTLFDIEHPDWSLAEVSAKTGLSKTTAYRMLRTMEEEEFVVFHKDTERYSIGRAIIPVSYLAFSYIRFSHLAHPILEKLAAETGETAELGETGHDGTIIIDHVPTSHPFKPNLPIGRVLRNLANSGSKMLVAHMPEEKRERILNEKHVALTPNTVTDPDELRKILAAAKEAGVAFDIEEQEIGVCAVSAPVFGLNDEVIAVVAIVAPADRFGIEARERNAEAVKAAAIELADCVKHPFHA